MLTREQFETVKQETFPLIDSFMKDDCLKQARILESQLSGLETDDPQLFYEMSTWVAQLKWVACGLLSDAEFYTLIKNHLLEGIELSANDFLNLLGNKFANTFNIGLADLLNNSVVAIRENMQTIGEQPIIVKNETKPARSVIHNWLIDFLRNTDVDNPGEMEVNYYLFNTPNATALSSKDQHTLGKVFSLYTALRALSAQATESDQEYQALLPQILAKERTRQKDKDNEEVLSQSEPKPQSTQTTSPPNQSYVIPPKPTAPANIPQATPARTPDSYREPVSQTDLTSRFKPEPKQPESKINGNVIDLRKME